MKSKTITMLNRFTKKAYKAARQMDMEFEALMEDFWNFIFPDKPKNDKPKPRAMSTAYPDGRRIIHNTQK